MVYSSIGILGCLILLIENQDILHNRNGAFDLPAWRVYRRFLFTVLVYYVTDILWGLLESRKLAVPLFIDTSVYFIAMAVGVLFWAQYTVIYLDEKGGPGRFLILAGRLIAGMITVLAIVNIFMPVLFTVDKNSVYTALPARYVILGCQILLLLLISAWAFYVILRRRREARDREKYRTVALFGLIMAFFLIAQFWLPYLPLYAIAYMLGTCLLRAFVIGEEKEDFRYRLEEADRVAVLKQSLTALLDNMPALSASKDAETGVYLACNQAFAEYAHRESPEGVVGLTDDQIFDPVTAGRFVEDDRMALSMDKPYIFFEDVADAAGNRRQFQTTKLKFIDAQGRLCTLGMFQDVTDMVRIQRENATTREAYEKARSTGIIYTHLAQALARGYTELFYVNLSTGEFIQYRPEEESGMLKELRRGEHFFESCREEAELYVSPEDRESFLRAMDRQTLTKALARSDCFVMAYRLLTEDGPAYVSMKASRMVDDERFIVIGVSDIGEQMEQRRAAERVREERAAYARINALVGDFLCVHVVDPETGHYREYSVSAEFESFALPGEGEDFFPAARAQYRNYVYSADLERFLLLFTAENVLAEIRRCGIFSMTCRLVMHDGPVFVQCKAALVEEQEGARLIVGLSDIDALVRQEEEYSRRLAQAQSEANIDALTGIRNRHAYLDAEGRLNRLIAEGRAPAFAVVVLDVNNLKRVNDTAGHQMGDLYLRDACGIICGIFKHSPVFRVGGDEFAVIAEGSDLDNIDALLGRVNHHNAQALQDGGVVIACGMARCDHDASVAAVFDRADVDMYNNKRALKEVNP